MLVPYLYGLIVSIFHLVVKVKLSASACVPFCVGVEVDFKSGD